MLLANLYLQRIPFKCARAIADQIAISVVPGLLAQAGGRDAVSFDAAQLPLAALFCQR